MVIFIHHDLYICTVLMGFQLWELNTEHFVSLNIKI